MGTVLQEMTSVRVVCVWALCVVDNVNFSEQMGGDRERDRDRDGGGGDLGLEQADLARVLLMVLNGLCSIV